MALNRRDVIIACLAVIVAWLWTAHFLPSIRLVPYAFVLGTLTAVLGAFYIVFSTSRGLGYGTTEAFPPSTFLNITAPISWEQETAAEQQRNHYKPLKLYAVSPPISERLDELLHLIWQDFVKSWYIKISPGSCFINEVDRATRSSFEAILGSIARLDVVEFGVTKVLPILNSHVKAFSEAERLVRGKRLNLNVTETQELEIAIAGRYRDGKLHPAASLAASKTTALQQQHLRRLCEKILPVVLPANMQSSPSVLVLVREIIASAVLLPVMVLLADPDVLNQLIEAYGRTVLYERKTVRKLRAALDEHTSAAPKNSKPSRLPRLARDDSERSFEKFVRAIRQCASLPDARKFRSEVLRQIKRESEMPNRDQTYLRRLEIGRKLLDQRVIDLSSQLRSASGSLDAASDAGRKETRSDPSKMSLRDVLYDASGLSYFMEYMDRLQLVAMVQFWIVVDGFRSPLDQDLTSGTRTLIATDSWDRSDRDVMVQITGSYFSRPELKVPQKLQSVVDMFLKAGDGATYQQYSAARRAVLTVQESLYEEMDATHFSAFKRSDLYYKWLATDVFPVAASVNGDMPEQQNSNQPQGLTKSILASTKNQELRRAIASSSDLPSVSRRSVKIAEPRRSLDDASERPPLFDEDEDEDPLTRSTQSLPSIHEDMLPPSNGDQTKMMSAVQAALDEIVDEEPDQDSVFSGWRSVTPDLNESRVSVFDSAPSSNPIPISQGPKPSLSSLGLVGTPSRRTVFSEGDLFGENEGLWEEDRDEDETVERPGGEEDIHEAAPGDLGLSELVQSLSLEIDKLEAQLKVVEALMNKAELTNNTAELRILRKSKSSLDREIHRKELQRQQYIIQKSENDLYGKADISIKSIMVGTEPDGHEYALYVIEVQRRGGEKAPLVTWAIARRYSEFHDLHRQLRKRHPSIRELEFPRRQMMLTLQKDFLKKRSAALQKYLRELLSRPQICRSLEFRAFLSQQAIRPIADTNGEQIDKQDFITRIYNSVTDGMEEFIGNVPVLDQLSAAGQNLITAASGASLPGLQGANLAMPSIADNPREAAEAQAEINAFETRQDPEMVTFIKPICDIFLELFQLNQGNNWLRGRAVVVVTQQLLGGTIERKVRDTYKAHTSEDNIARYLDLLRDTMWPGGRFRTSPPARTETQKAASRQNASVVLATLLPDLAGGVVGRGNAANAGRRIFGTMNNERLNLHLAYTILDEIVDGILGVRVGR